MSNPGIFFLVSGPSGAGKTAVLGALLRSLPDLQKAISVTTRTPRTGEVDGCDYHFWTKEAFAKAVGQGLFLEHAQVHGRDFYGTLKKGVEERLASGGDLIKDIDVQGAGSIRAIMPYPKTVAIFLVPPSLEVLIQRLAGRGTEDRETVERRLKTARGELDRAGEFDYLVVNREVESAAVEVAAIRMAETRRMGRHWEAFRKRWCP